MFHRLKLGDFMKEDKYIIKHIMKNGDAYENINQYNVKTSLIPEIVIKNLFELVYGENITKK